MRDDIATYVDALFVVYSVVILVRILLSWVRVSPMRQPWRAIHTFFYESTDWFLNFFRRVIPPVGILDISPIVALIVLWILQRLAVELILGL